MKKSLFLICGATSDLGYALISGLADVGGNSIVAAGRDEEKLAALSSRFDSIEKTHTLNLSIEDDVKHMIKRYISLGIKFDGIVCLAGRHEMKPLRAYSKAAMIEIFDDNFYSSANVINNCGRVIEDGGSIVLVSTAATLRGAGAVGGYVASKSALEGLTKAAAIEFASKRVRVNCISPGVFESNMTMSFFATVGDDATKKIRGRHPLGCGSPSDVAGPIRFLLSNDSAWITGQNILVDGGFAINA